MCYSLPTHVPPPPLGTILIPKGCGVSIYGHKCNLYMLTQVHKSYLIYYVFEILLETLSYVKEKIKNIPILDIDDHNTMYVFASKSTHATYM